MIYFWYSANIRFRKAVPALSSSRKNFQLEHKPFANSNS